ncbi:MAG TPA: translocation/assembly module TamB domain-containing protein [Candidatus Polarisedimenticolaceae bacterium]|nr:translocation/assembly module TamB domain-containing protein [Candidatus Polarisedimenticolaceae bacterium]
MTRARKIGTGALLLLLMLGGAAFWLVGTASGLRALLSWAGGLLPGELSMGQVRGVVRGPLEVHDLVYSREGLMLRVQRVAFDWHLRDLLRKRIDLLWLEASGVRVVSTPSPTPSEESPLVDVDLGFDLMVRRANVRDVVVQQAAGDPVRIGNITLRGRTRGQTFVVDRLRAQGPDFSLAVSGRLTPIGAYPLDLKVDWVLAEAPGRPRLAAHGTLSGTVEDLRVDQSLTAPHRARVRGVVHDPFTDLRLVGSVATTHLPLSLLAEDLPPATLGGTLTARGSLEALQGSADLTVDSAEYGTFRAQGPWSWNGSRVGLDGFALRHASGRLHARVSGTVDTGENAGFDLRATWSALAWPLQGGEPTVTSGGGNLRLHGTADAWSLTYAGAARVPGVVQGRLEMQGRVAEDRLQIQQATYTTLGGTLSGAGRVTLAPTVAWSLDLQARNLDPAGLVPALSGSVDGETRVTGSLQGDTAVGTLAPLTFRGKLQGAPLAGRAETVRYRGSEVWLEAARAVWGGATLSADGHVTEPLALRVGAEVPDLGTLVPGAAGNASGSGHITGTYAAPVVESEGRGAKLTWSGVEAGTLSWSGTAGLAPEAPLQLSVIAQDLHWGEMSAGRAALRTTGTAADHRLRFALEGTDGALQVSASGSLLGGPAWRGTLDTLGFGADGIGSWTLAQPAALVASGEELSLDEACLASSGSRLCLRGRWGAEAGGSGQLEIARLPLALAEPWIAGEVGLDGSLDGTIAADFSAGGLLTGQGDLALSAGALTFGTGEAATSFRFSGGEMTMRATEAGAEGHASLTLDGGALQAQVSATDPIRLPLDPQRLAFDARLRADLATLEPLSALVPQATSLQGRLSADLRAGGTLAEPRLGGEATLRGGAADVPALGLELRDAQLTARPAEDGRIALDGSVRSGPGTLHLQGTVGPGLSLKLQAIGERVLAADQGETHVLVSPDLTLAYDGSLLRITGQVTVPEGTVALDDGGGEAVVPVSSDVVVLGAEKAGPAERPMQVSADVRIVLGDDVHFQGEGIEADLTGSVRVQESPGLPTRASGEIVIEEGSYTAYGQDLKIERGRLYYAGGPVTDPGIDLRASRTAEDGVVAGVDVTGSLSEPQVTLWSDPTLPETDQLSYLILGRPSSSASASDVSLLSRAATALGVKGGNLLVGGLAGRLGLEEAKIETGEGGYRTASLILGTYLSPRLYVAYGVGLFEPESLYRIRYTLDEHWTLQAETGGSTNGEIEYAIESGPGGRRPTPREGTDVFEDQP